MSGGKRFLFAVWLLSALAFLAPGDSALASAGRTVFWILVVAHTIECAIFLPRLRRAPGSLGHHLMQTFLYGILYVRELPASQGASGGNGHG
jgi:uncharacterized protein YhhL (DUF1145 family)